MDDRHWATSGLSAGQQFEHFCAKLLVRPLMGWGREAHEHLLVGFFYCDPFFNELLSTRQLSRATALRLQTSCPALGFYP